MNYNKVLELVRAHSRDGHPTRRQVYGALQVLTEGDHSKGLVNMGIEQKSWHLLGKGDAGHIARDVLMVAIVGEPIPDEDDDEYRRQLEV